MITGEELRSIGCYAVERLPSGVCYCGYLRSGFCRPAPLLWLDLKHICWFSNGRWIVEGWGLFGRGGDRALYSIVREATKHESAMLLARVLEEAAK